MNKKLWLLILPVLLLIGYISGPSPSTPDYDLNIPSVPSTSEELEQVVTANESRNKLKPDNQARIIWANDSLKQQTEYSIVYLHGFSASQAEGEPVHRNIAEKFGCNLYLSRLAEHGIDTAEQLLNLTAEGYWESAKAAFAVGQKLGKKVILMGTSTGGTLALMLAANYPDIASVVLLSPNIQIADSKAWLLNNHWGLQIARLAKNSNYIESNDARPVYRQYWSTPYRIEAAVALQELIETAMNEETFNAVKQPVLLLYYYKNEEEQDEVVKVSAMHEMFNQLGSPGNMKKSVAMPKTGHHVIGSYIKSKDVEGVEREISSFLSATLNR